MKNVFSGGAGMALACLVIIPPAAAQDWTLAPTFGSDSIGMATGGFVSVDLAAGGNIPAARALGGNCVGTIADAPDFRLMLTGNGRGVLDMVALSNEDTTLVVHLPDGEFLCVDDSVGSLNPYLGIADAGPGAYDIWVGTYSQVPGYFPPATLAIEFVAGDGTGDGMADTADEGGFYYERDGSPVGPVTLAEVERQVDLFYIFPDTLMWRDGMADWAPAEQLDAIAPLFSVGPPPLPPPSDEDGPPVGPPPLPPPLPDDQAGEGSRDIRMAIMDACRVVAERELEGRMEEVEEDCTCIVDHLMDGGLDDSLLDQFARAFMNAADTLETVNPALFQEIDRQCF